MDRAGRGGPAPSGGIDWTLTSTGAHIKLTRLYPSFDE